MSEKDNRFFQLRLVVTSCYNFLPHVISIFNWIISNENAMHCGAFLPWLLKQLYFGSAGCIFCVFCIFFV
jgi:hypothetical protein